jgi:pilus assembly protein Flp/PilA
MGGAEGEGQPGNLNAKEVGRMLFLPREEGQGLVEFALILVLLAIVVIVILAVLGPTIGNWVEDIIEDL